MTESGNIFVKPINPEEADALEKELLAIQKELIEIDDEMNSLTLENCGGESDSFMEDMKKEIEAMGNPLDDFIGQFIPEDKITQSFLTSWKSEILDPFVEKWLHLDPSTTPAVETAKLELEVYKQFRDLVVRTYKTTDPEINLSLETLDKEIESFEIEIINLEDGLNFK